MKQQNVPHKLCLFGLIMMSLVSCNSKSVGDSDASKHQVQDGPPRIIPMEDFFRNPLKTSFDLSPDGTHVAFLMPWENRLNVFVQKIGQQEATRLTDATQRDIAGFGWGNSQRIVYAQDTGGDENFRGYAVNIDGSNPKELTPFENVQAGIVDLLVENDEEMLIRLNKRNPRVFDVYRVNINTAELTLVAENPGNVTGWMTDNAGKLRIAVVNDGVTNTILYRKTESDEFKPLISTSFKDTITPLDFTFDDQALYVSSNIGRDKQAIFTFDPEKGEHGELIYEHPEVDVSSLMRSRHRKVITGVVFERDRIEYHFFDQEREELQAALQQKLPGVHVAMASRSRDEKKVLVRTYSDRSLGAYYFFDRETDALTKLTDISPWLVESEMAEMKPIEFKSRDGLVLHGYLTLPKGFDPKNLPVVINPHGGPWVRDSWGFNPEVQFLANRGYAVLQVNYRGSTGYGKAFWQASFKQWGKAMQDDLTDGGKWLIEQGIADPKRIGIYGGSYGGYAVLAGLAFTPDFYACGVDYVGVSSLFTFLEAFPPYWKPLLDMVYEMIGHPENEKELLKAASPVFHVDKIKAPLFVAQGANDPRVKKAESDQLVEALKAKGIDVPYMVKDNEGHGFRNEENRFDFYRAMEQFLSKYLGGRVEPAIPDPKST